MLAGREVLTYLSALGCCCVVSFVCHSSCFHSSGILWVAPSVVTTLTWTVSMLRFIHHFPVLSADFCARDVLTQLGTLTQFCASVSLASSILQKDILCSSGLFGNSQASLFPIHLQLLMAYPFFFKNIKSLTLQIVFRN